MGRWAESGTGWGAHHGWGLHSLTASPRPSKPLHGSGFSRSCPAWDTTSSSSSSPASPPKEIRLLHLLLGSSKQKKALIYTKQTHV